MINLEAIPGEVRAWVEGHLIPELDMVKGFIKAHAAQGAQVAKLAEQIVEAADPAAAPAVAALASTARTVAEKGQKLLEDITSKL